MKKIITIMLALVLLVSAGATDGAYVKDAKAFSILPEDESVNISEPSTENTYELDEDKPYLLLPLTVEKTGTVKFTVSFQGFTETAWVNLRTDADMDAIGEVERTLKLLEPETSAGCTLSYTFTEANTYYLFILLEDSDQTKAGSVTLKMTFSAASSDSEAKPSTSTSTSTSSTQATQKTPATVKWKSVKNTAKKKVTVQWKKSSFCNWIPDTICQQEKLQWQKNNYCQRCIKDQISYIWMC